MRPLGHLRDPEVMAVGERLVATGPLAASADISGRIATIYNQRGNSCVGRALSQCIWIVGGLDASAHAIYALARQLAEPFVAHLVDRGCYPYRALEALEECGIVATARWDESVDLSVPVPYDVLEAGYDGLVTGIWRVYDAGEERLYAVRKALTDGFPVFFGMDVDAEYMDGRFGTYQGVNQVRGGHAQVIVGYRDSRFLVCNSWGRDWADGGFAWIDERYIADPEHVYDVTLITAAPRVIQ